MKTEDLKARFNALYDKMVVSKDVANMKLFGAAFGKMFDKVASSMPDLAFSTIEMLSAVEFHNFVTMAEAQETAATFINDDKVVTGRAENSRGAHWRPDEVKAVLSPRGIALEESPFYNWWALWLTVNMMYSDYADTLAELIGSKDQERLAVACYKMAIRHLKDPDRPHFIREYFHLD